MSMFKIDGTLYGRRGNDGDVILTVFKPDRLPIFDSKTEVGYRYGLINIETQYIIPANIWASAVLNLTKDGEQPGDWHKFMDFHNKPRPRD